MSNKIITVGFSEILSSNRLEPRFFHYQKVLEKTFNKYSFEYLGNFSSLKSGSTPIHYKERNNKNDFYFIKSADVKRYNINFSTISFVSDRTHLQRTNLKVVPNDVLLSNTGKYLGFSSVIPLTIKEATTNQNIVRIRLNDNSKTIFTPFFISSFFNSLFGQIEIESLLTLTGQKYLNMEKLKDFKIPKVSKDLIELTTKKTKETIQNEIKFLELLKQAQNIFYQKIGVDFSKIKKKKYYSVNLSDFSEHDLWNPSFLYPLYVNTLKEIQKQWKTIPLGLITTFKKGDEAESDNYISYLNKKKTDIPFVRTSDLVNYSTDQFPDFYVSEEILEEKEQDLQDGDILFTKDGKIGMSAMITQDEKLLISSGIVRIRLKEESENYNITQEYLFTILSLKETGFYPSIRRTVVASTIPHLREERLKEIEIPILDKQSIDEITQLVKEAFKLKDKKKKMIREMREEIDSYFSL